MKYPDGVEITPMVRVEDAQKEDRTRALEILASEYDSDVMEEKVRFIDERRELLDILDEWGWSEWDSDFDYYDAETIWETVTGFKIVIWCHDDDYDAPWNRGKQYWHQGEYRIKLEGE